MLFRSRIEEARIVHAELADQRIERHHLGGVVRRHLHGLLGRQDIEFVRVEDQFVAAAAVERLPEVKDAVFSFLVDINDGGVVLAAIPSDMGAGFEDGVDGIAGSREGNSSTGAVTASGGGSSCARSRAGVAVLPIGCDARGDD